MREKIEAANRIAKLRARAATVEERLDAVEKATKRPVGGKRIPGDGDGDGIAYEGRGKKGGGGLHSGSTKEAAMVRLAAVTAKMPEDKFAAGLSEAMGALKQTGNVTAAVRLGALKAGVTPEKFGEALGHVTRFSGQIGVSGNAVDAAAKLSGKSDGISSAERAAGARYAAQNTHSGAKGINSLSARLASGKGGERYSDVKDELNTINGLLGNSSDVKPMKERVATASQVARTHSAMKDNHAFTASQKKDIADALTGAATYDSEGNLVRRKN